MRVKGRLLECRGRGAWQGMPSQPGLVRRRPDLLRCAERRQDHEDATEEKRQWEVFGGQDREGVSVESDPDHPSPPGGQRCPQTVRRERGQEVARDDQELLRVLGRCIEDLPSLCGMLEVRLENVQHGGGKGPGQVRFEVGAHGVNRYAACDAKTRLKRTECFTRQRLWCWSLKCGVWQRGG